MNMLTYTISLLQLTIAERCCKIYYS